MMKPNNPVLKTAIAGLLTAGAMALSAPVLAGDKTAGEPEMEQCAGVIKGGKNDCATSTNACHGHVKEDGNPEAWIYVPKGTCDKIAGARVVVVEDPTPKGKKG